MFASRGLRISPILRKMFLRLPCRDKFMSVLDPREPPGSPHRIKCSAVGISPLLKLGAYFLECHRCEPAHRIGSQAAALIHVLPVPAARELLYDPGSLAAVGEERLIESQPSGIVTKELACTGVTGQFATEVKIK